MVISNKKGKVDSLQKPKDKGENQSFNGWTNTWTRSKYRNWNWKSHFKLRFWKSTKVIQVSSSPVSYQKQNKCFLEKTIHNVFPLDSSKLNKLKAKKYEIWAESQNQQIHMKRSHNFCKSSVVTTVLSLQEFIFWNC